MERLLWRSYCTIGQVASVKKPVPKPMLPNFFTLYGVSRALFVKCAAMFGLRVYLSLPYNHFILWHGPLSRYVKLRVVHAPGMPGTFSPLPTLKALVSAPGMHHGTCVTHVSLCMSRSLTPRWRENIPGIPGECANRNFTYLVGGPWHH